MARAQGGELQALQQDTGLHRLAAIALAVQQSKRRAAQQLAEGTALGVAHLLGGGQAQLAGQRIAEERLRERVRTEMRVVGAGADDGGKRPQHRACERRDHDLRRRVAAQRRGIRGALQHLGHPGGEAGRIEVAAPRLLQPGGRAGVGAATQGVEHLRARGVALERLPQTGLLQGLAQRHEPVRERQAPRGAGRQQGFLNGLPAVPERQGLAFGRRGAGLAQRVHAMPAPVRLERVEPCPGTRCGFHPVEQRVGRGARLCGAQQADHRGRGARGRQPPAGFVAKTQRLALEQSAHAAQQDAVERDQGHRRFAAGEVPKHLGGTALRLVFKVAAGGQAHAGKHFECAGVRRVRVQPEHRHVGASEQRLDQRVAGTATERHPGARALGMQQVGRGRIGAERPLERELRKRALTTARPGRRTRADFAARGFEPGGAARGRQGQARTAERVRGVHDLRDGPIERARVALGPVGCALREQLGAAQRIGRGIEGERTRLGRRRGGERARERLGRLEARQPGGLPGLQGPGRSRQRQVLRERQQHDDVVRLQRVASGEVAHATSHLLPAARHGEPGVQCDFQAGSRRGLVGIRVRQQARPLHRQRADPCVRIILPWCCSYAAPRTTAKERIQ